MNYLTDKQLLEETLYWSQKEREALTNVLWRLKEIDERKLFVELKCRSLFDYCVSFLKYSEGQASRRVSAARLLKQLPEIASDIKKGDLTLTQLNQAKTFFEEENIKRPEEKKEVLELIMGKTTRETEKVLWDLKKEEAPRKVNLTLLEETVEELKKLRELKAHSCPDMDSLLKKMCGVVGDVWDPMIVKRKRKITLKDSRYIQVGVKAAVWERDQGQCVNCGSTLALEVDHIEPYAVGGKTEVENLRLLCHACNQRKAVMYFGKRISTFK